MGAASFLLRVEQRNCNRKEAKMAEEHEENVRGAADKIFFSHLDSILMQALLQKYDILDCVTVMNLWEAPSTVEVKLASEFISEHSAHGDPFFEDIKAVIEHGRQNDYLIVVVISLWPSSSGGMTRARILSKVPGLCTSSGSWSAAQKDKKITMHDALENVQRCPDEMMKQLQDLRLANAAVFDK
jgi:hypothetical protein